MRNQPKQPKLGSADTEPGIELKLSDFKKTKGIYDPKDIVIICDELGELMNNDDFKSVSSIKEALGSLARLGRAAGFHLVLATQKATGSVISSELMNNIHQSVLLGEFDSGVSTSMFEKDISYKAKPEIKGRGYSKVGKEIVEFQSYWTTEKDFKYKDETLFDSIAKQKGLKPEDIKFKESEEKEPASSSDRGFPNPSMFAKKDPPTESAGPRAQARERMIEPDFGKLKDEKIENLKIGEKEKEYQAPERTLSRNKALDESGDIDYSQFLS